MKYSVGNIPEFEKQRRNYIKKNNNYLEVKLLVGSEDTDDSPNTSVIPSVATEFHNVGPIETAYMYATLNALIKDWEKRYPMECLFANQYLDVEDMGTVYCDDLPKDDKED